MALSGSRPKDWGDLMFGREPEGRLKNYEQECHYFSFLPVPLTYFYPYTVDHRCSKVISRLDAFQVVPWPARPASG